MGKWLRHQWDDIKGNAKWAAICLLAGTGPTMLTFLYSMWKYLGHHTASTLELFLMPLIVFVVCGVGAFVLWFRIQSQRFRVRLIPHGDNDESVYLQVKNQGDTIDLSAQLEIIGSSAMGFKTRPFEGQWKNENVTTDFYNQQPEFVAGEVRIESNKSRLLGIASIASMVAQPVQEMIIVGIDNELIGWESNPRQIQELPYFIVRITLVAKGYTKSKEVAYKVGPKTAHGPFQMTEVDV